MTSVINDLKKADRRLLVYRSILNSRIVQKYLSVIKLLESNESRELVDEYYKLTSLLIEREESKSHRGTGDAWQNFLLDLILEDENTYSLQAQTLAFCALGSSLKKAVKNDLRYLEKLYIFNGKKLKSLIREKIPSGYSREVEDLPDWNGLSSKVCTWNKEKIEIKRKLNNSDDWRDHLNALYNFYRNSGPGIFNEFRALKWQNRDHEYNFTGIKNIDQITFSDLIGYERQKSQIKKNTEKLLSGYRANNILLYGNRGTGKSSLVKAVMNHYCNRGLRLIEISKEDVFDFPRIIDRLSGINLKFIVFLDDLSFSEGEGEYRELKAILEGTVQRLPANVVIYATSNRRHLIKEYFSDKSPGSGEEVREQDTLQEKLSLADRFGICISFYTPTPGEYLNIVKELAVREGLDIEQEKLKEEARHWELRQNERSGRTARQFIDYLTAEKALDAKE